MSLHHASEFEQARLARDPRYDGRFFVGVLTTGIYCRPICPANLPKAENIRFFDSALNAQQAGLRPCLRCRPESAPGSSAWRGTEAVVGRAQRLIEQGDWHQQGASQLATRLGVTDRHLRRLFVQHLGVTPVQYANHHRLMLARRLLVQTTLPVADVAVLAGFGSQRRFHEAFQQAFNSTPLMLRRNGDEQPGTRLTLQLSYRPPYDWDSMLAFLRSRFAPAIEHIGDADYQRWYLTESGDPASYRVRHLAARHCLEVEIEQSSWQPLAPLLNALRRQFDLDANPMVIGDALAQHRGIAPLVTSRPGLRLPGSFNPWEAALRGVLGQQVSIAAATTHYNRLIEALGQPHQLGERRFHKVPTPQQVASSDLEMLKMPQARKTALRALAGAVIAEPDFFAAQRIDDLYDRLLALPGFGPWTARYILLRAMSDSDAFPDQDLIIKRRLQALNLTTADCAQFAPWRGYLTLHLWAS